VHYSIFFAMPLLLQQCVGDPGGIDIGCKIAKKINIYFSRRQWRGNGCCDERETAKKGGCVGWIGRQGE